MKTVTPKNINLATATSPLTIPIASDTELINLYGNKTLSANFAIQASGTPSDSCTITMLFPGAVTASGNAFSIFGVTLSPDVIKVPFFALCFYSNSAWSVIYGPQRVASLVTGGGLAIDGTTGGIKIDSDVIVDAMVKTTAAIDTDKLKALTASQLVITGGGGKLASAAVATYPSLSELAFLKGVSSAIQTQLAAKTTSGNITNADLNAAAAIALTKLAASTFNTIPKFGATGLLEPTAVTPTQLSYVDFTSSGQTQLNAKAATSYVDSSVATVAASVNAGKKTYTKSSSATIVLNGSATSYYKLNTTSNAIAVTMPAASAFAANSSITITQVFSGGATRVTVSPAGADALEVLTGADAASFVYVTTGESHVFVTNGTDHWYMLS